MEQLLVGRPVKNQENKFKLYINLHDMLSRCLGVQNRISILDLVAYTEVIWGSEKVHDAEFYAIVHGHDL